MEKFLTDLLDEFITKPTPAQCRQITSRQASNMSKILPAANLCHKQFLVFGFVAIIAKLQKQYLQYRFYITGFGCLIFKHSNERRGLKRD
ncbi:hypothetical protein SDC9_208265 [bioreactor metagenome]|uniref:Uncharacterized protein n=1 Tax=bioreactor metagenome TaxID=1076179 RepID=A0A645JAV6_9ZZZZ